MAKYVGFKIGKVYEDHVISEYYCGGCGGAFRECDARDLEAENAKLHELCRDLQFCRGNDCLKCSHGRFCDLRLDERCRELQVPTNA